MQYSLSALAFATTVLATTHEISVGPGLDYSPSSISDVAVGDILAFKFGSGHDVVAGSFDAPCQPLSNGVYSGLSPEEGSTFSFLVNSTDPQVFYCSVPRHCSGGMAMVINPSGDQSLSAYTSAARSASETSPQGDAIGGTFGSLESSGSSSSSESSSGSSATDSASSTVASAASSASEAIASASASATKASASASSSAASASASATGSTGAGSVLAGPGFGLAGLMAAGVALVL